MKEDKRFTCPSCGFETLHEPTGGTYDICKICGWEDDPVQLNYPGLCVGANKESLIECQKNILKVVPVETKEYKGYKRDAKWRPLKEEEVIIPGKKNYKGIDYFHDSDKTPTLYWLRKNNSD
jgi:hypothetical protein